MFRWLLKIYSNIYAFSTNHKYIGQFFEKKLYYKLFINWIGLGLALFYDFNILFLVLFFL